VAIAITNSQSIAKVNTKIARKIAKKVFNACGADFSISLVFTDNKTISDLNFRYLGRKYNTDVLAFLLEEAGSYKGPKGEVIVSVEKARENAVLYGNSLSEELALYIVHGILHLLGYKDNTKYLKEKMQKKENLILKTIDKELKANLCAIRK